MTTLRQIADECGFDAIMPDDPLRELSLALPIIKSGKGFCMSPNLTSQRRWISVELHYPCRFCGIDLVCYRDVHCLLSRLRSKRPSKCREITKHYIPVKKKRNQEALGLIIFLLGTLRRAKELKRSKNKMNNLETSNYPTNNRKKKILCFISKEILQENRKKMW